MWNKLFKKQMNYSRTSIRLCKCDGVIISQIITTSRLTAFDIKNILLNDLLIELITDQTENLELPLRELILLLRIDKLSSNSINEYVTEFKDLVVDIQDDSKYTDSVHKKSMTNWVTHKKSFNSIGNSIKVITLNNTIFTQTMSQHKKKTMLLEVNGLKSNAYVTGVAIVILVLISGFLFYKLRNDEQLNRATMEAVFSKISNNEIRLNELEMKMMKVSLTMNKMNEHLNMKLFKLSRELWNFFRVENLDSHHGDNLNFRKQIKCILLGQPQSTINKTMNLILDRKEYDESGIPFEKVLKNNLIINDDKQLELMEVTLFAIINFSKVLYYSRPATAMIILSVESESEIEDLISKIPSSCHHKILVINWNDAVSAGNTTQLFIKSYKLGNLQLNKNYFIINKNNKFTRLYVINQLVANERWAWVRQDSIQYHTA
jgi:hypothetical protein